MLHIEMLGIIHDNGGTKFRKRHVDFRDIDKIDKHLTDQRELHMGQDGKLVMAADIQINVPSDREVYIRNILRTHERMCSRHLWEINITEMTIELVTNAKLFKSHTCRDGPRTRELKQVNIDKHLGAGVIEPTAWEWAAPVLFV